MNDHSMRKGGTAPFLAALSVMLAAAPISAEEALRDAPPEGAVVHIAAQTTTTRDGKMMSEFKTTLEQRVTASQDGLKWEASINITHEEDQGLDKLSAAGLRDYLLAVSAGRRTVYRAFMLVESATTQFTPPAKPDGSFVGTDAGWVVRTSLDCPWDQFQHFFPIGQMPVVLMGASAGPGFLRTTSQESLGRRSLWPMMATPWPTQRQAISQPGASELRKSTTMERYQNG